MARKICIFNGKGGVGKSTSAINIAAFLSKQEGKKVLLVDMDVQSNCTNMMVDEPEKNMLDLLMNGGQVTDYIVPSNCDNIDVIPMINTGVREETIYIDSFTDREKTLKKHLKKIENSYDYIIVDCPPALNEFTKNALVASDYVMIPFRADKFAYEGLERLFTSIAELKNLYNLNISILGVFMTHYYNTKVNTQTKKLLEDDLGDEFFQSTIRLSTTVSESTFDKPLIYYKPYDSVTYDYKRLVSEMTERIENNGI